LYEGSHDLTWFLVRGRQRSISEQIWKKGDGPKYWVPSIEENCCTHKPGNAGTPETEQAKMGILLPHFLCYG
jgi:hypothetical protein